MNFKIVNCYCYSGLPGGSVVITNKAVNFNVEEQHEIVSLKKLFAICLGKLRAEFVFVNCNHCFRFLTLIHSITPNADIISF